MPDRYEREIEDILRNLKNDEPRGIGPLPRRNDFRRRAPGPQLPFPEWCLVAAIAVALLSGGWADAAGANLLTGLLALVGTALLALVACSAFIVRQRPPTSRWR